MRFVDSHFHWYPRSVWDALCSRPGWPHVEADGKGGYRYSREGDPVPSNTPWAAWFDLDEQLAHMDALGHEIDVISSLGPFSIYFSELSKSEGKEASIEWNEIMAATQRTYPGRFFGTAAVPLVDTETAIDVVNRAAADGLVGVNLPGSVGGDPRIDADRLEPFFARVEQLRLPLMLHPTDAIFAQMLDGYNDALHVSLGRVMELSVAAMRLILSGIMERHPDLIVVMSHMGGALPYQSGRMDKNAKRAHLPQDISVYLKRMYTDTVQPHAAGMKFGVEYFGADHVMYGTDYPCWMPEAALRFFAECGFDEATQAKIMGGNARRIFRLDEATAAIVAGRPRELVAAR